MLVVAGLGSVAIADNTKEIENLQQGLKDLKTRNKSSSLKQK